MVLFANVPMEQFWTAVGGSFVFGLIGIILILFGFKLFDWILRNIDFEKELIERNYCVTAVICSLILGVAYIIGQVVQ